MLKIAAILNEARSSYATHNRKLKELSLLRSKSPSPSHFFSAFSKTLTPLFDFHRHLASIDHVISFVSNFAAAADDEFLDHFLKFLLAAAAASNKTARYRACQIVSEHFCMFMFRIYFSCTLIESFRLPSSVTMIRSNSLHNEVTCGGCQSAHTAAIAVLCAEKGIVSHLLLRGEQPEILTGYNLMSTMYGNVTYVPRTVYANREEMLKSYANSVAGNNGSVLWFAISFKLPQRIDLFISPNFMQMDVSRSEGSHLRKILVVNEGAGDSVALLGKGVWLTQAEVSIYRHENRGRYSRSANFVLCYGRSEITTVVAMCKISLRPEVAMAHPVMPWTCNEFVFIEPLQTQLLVGDDAADE
ncbi:hypothetical protein Fmac_032759 [Flemingia macrophylla]|uniref:Uncharacterized protein n=1 Tax=Flemingia macrophylla TaxID=520843 RepID=A0ABD1L5U3_9FABA